MAIFSFTIAFPNLEQILYKNSDIYLSSGSWNEENYKSGVFWISEIATAYSWIVPDPFIFASESWVICLIHIIIEFMKQLSIKEIQSQGTVELAEYETLLEAVAEYEAVETINWKEYPYRPRVGFRIAYTKEHFLLKYYVEEKSIKASATQIHDDVHKDSCVEFFLAPDGGEAYYNFEFSCIGVAKVAYGSSRHHRQPVDVEILNTIRTRSTLGNQSFKERSGGWKWELMIMIPFDCMVHHPGIVLKGNIARANFYKCGDETLFPHYVSRSPVDTALPDFHQPEFFGEIVFE